MAIRTRFSGVTSPVLFLFYFIVSTCIGIYHLTSGIGKLGIQNRRKMGRGKGNLLFARGRRGYLVHALLNVVHGDALKFESFLDSGYYLGIRLDFLMFSV